MTGIDSNVLIRFIVRDDEDQFLKAQELLVQGSSSANPCYVCDIAIAEMIWVLTRRYRIPAATLIDFIKDLVAANNIVIESSEQLRRALDAWKSSGADLADCFIGELNKKAGCTKTVTFDKGASKLESFELLA